MVYRKLDGVDARDVLAYPAEEAAAIPISAEANLGR